MRIKPYEQTVQAERTIQSRSGSVVDSGYGELGEAIQQGAASYLVAEKNKALREEKAAKLKEKEYARQEVVEAQKLLAEYRTNVNEDIATSEVDGPDYAEKKTEQVKEWVAAIESGFNSNEAKDYIALHGETLVAGAFTDTLNKQRFALAAKNKADVETTHQAASNTVYSNPEKYDEVVGAISSDIEAGIGIYENNPDYNKEPLIYDLKQKLAWSAAMKVVKDPAGRQQVLSDNPPQWFDDLTPEKKETVLSHIDTYVKRDKAIADHALNQQVNNVLAHISLTGQPPAVKIPRGAFAGNEALHGVYTSAVKAAETLSASWGGTIEGARASVEALKPAYNPSDESYPKKVQIYQAAQEQLERREKLLVKDYMAADQSSYYGSDIPPVDFTKADPIGQIVRRLPFATARGEQLRLPTRILSDQEATQLAATVNNMDVNAQADFLKNVAVNLPEGAAATLYGQISSAAVGTDKKFGSLYSIEEAGRIMRASGSQGGESSDQTSRYILQGRTIQDARRPTLNQAYDAMKEVIAEASPEFVAQLPKYAEAVTDHYLGKLATQGRTDFDVKENSKEFKASVMAVIGDPVKIGPNRVIKPWGMEEDEFIDKVKAMTNRPWGSYGLRQITNGPDGHYQIVLNDIAKDEIINVFRPMPAPMTAPAKPRAPWTPPTMDRLTIEDIR